MFQRLQRLRPVLTAPDMNLMARLAHQAGQGASPSTSSHHTDRQGHAVRPMLAIMRQRTGGPMAVPAPLQQLEGSALIVGQGGIGSAITELLQHNCPQLTVLPLGRRSQPRLDLCCDGDLEQLSGWLQQQAPLRLVINTAGWLHNGGRGPEKRLQAVDRSGLEQAFNINAFAPILLAKAVAPAFNHGQLSWFASLSARVGSIGDNHLGGWYGYRAAKAAQNQLLRTWPWWKTASAARLRQPLAPRHNSH